ncbi:MAG: GTPase Era [Pseudomonadota bacterium]
MTQKHNDELYNNEIKTSTALLEKEGTQKKNNILDTYLQTATIKDDALGGVCQKTAIVSIIGKPNAGKSTLLNRIIGQKISIVTPKVQTTRSIITGVITKGDTQLILIDTPGIFEPKRNLEKAMVRAAWSSIISADFVMLILDAREELDSVQYKILERLKEHKVNLIVLINKMDLIDFASNTDGDDDSEKHQDKAMPWGDAQSFQISAQNGDGVDKLMSFLSENAPKGPWLYAEDDITTLPMRFLASEITREELFLALDQELPYNLTVETETWENFKDGSVKIRQVIIVSRASHKIIILGKNGGMIKMIGQKSRAAIKEALGFEVHLFLFVKVRENWDVDLCRSILAGA